MELQTKLGSLVVFATLILGCLAQENIQTRIPQSLEMCYNNSFLLERDNRLPMTINTLIELVKKIENTQGYNADMKQVSISLLHRFRMDGIERDVRVRPQPGILPYSPSGMQFNKHRILLSRLIPGSAEHFPNGTLTDLELCTLHFMLSSSIDVTVRADEQTVCNRLAQYRSQRVPRDVFDDRQKVRAGKNRVARFSALHDIDPTTNENEIPDEEPQHEIMNFEPRVNDNVNRADVSQCPVENGVIKTPWGAISAGAMMAGIATGFVPQTVTTQQLLQLKGRNVDGKTMNIDNRWAATLAGDIAEVALHQGPIVETIKVGASGAWNSSAIPRWYFLSQQQNFELTDAEIRGGLDGLILAMAVSNWRNQASTMRLSQLLEMYYSHHGVFDQNTRACNRNNLFSTVAPVATLEEQAAAFGVVLDKESRTSATLALSTIMGFSSSATNRLQTYIAQLNDVPCSVSQPIGDSVLRPIASDILIYVDTSMAHREIQPVLAQLLDGLDVAPLGSKYTLMNANSATVMLERSVQASQLATNWTAELHQRYPPGLSLPNILKSLKEVGEQLLEEEKTNSTVGGRSLVAIIVTGNANVNDGDKSYAIQQIQFLRESNPDLRILFFATGSPSRFAEFVQDERRDLLQLRLPVEQTDTSISGTVNPVIERFQQVPRRIINSRCGSSWQQSNTQNSQLTAYATPNTVTYYRLHPNYFFKKTDSNRRIKFQGLSKGPVTICQSRSTENPRNNTENTECNPILGNTHEIDLSNACDGHTLIKDCPPLYFSALGGQIQSAPGTVNMICTDINNCPLPTSIPFNIQTEGLDCFSSAGRVLQSIVPLALVFLMSMFGFI